MNVGITCYPTYGGSGIVATELGLELAARGHEVHFITYANPIRLDPGIAAHPLPRGGGLQLSAVPIPALLPGAGVAHGGGGRSPTSSTCCTSTTPFRIPSPPCWRSRCWRPRAACRSSPRCTAPTSRWWARTPPIFRSPSSPSSSPTASPPSASTCAAQTVEVFGVANEIRVIQNFVNCELYHPDDAKSGRRRLRAGRRETADSPFQFPPGEAGARLHPHSGRGAQERPGAPADGGRRARTAARPSTWRAS